MLEINLLPWRIQKQRREIYAQILSIILGIILSVIGSLILHRMLQLYSHRITFILQASNQQFNQLERQVLQIKQWQHDIDSSLEHEKFVRNIVAQQKFGFEKFSHVLQIAKMSIIFSEITLTKKSVKFVGKFSSIDLLMRLISALKQYDFYQINIKNIYRISKTNDFNFEVVAQ